jgi:hypothetical protein
MEVALRRPDVVVHLVAYPLHPERRRHAKAAEPTSARAARMGVDKKTAVGCCAAIDLVPIRPRWNPNAVMP